MRTLPDGCVNMVFADPPFNAGKEYADRFDDSKPVGEYQSWLSERITEAVRLLFNGGWFWLMNDQRHIGFCMTTLEQAGMTFRNIIVWAYTNPTPAVHAFSKTWRPILLYSKGEPSFFNAGADTMTKHTLYHDPSRATSHRPHDLWPDIPKLVGGFLAPPELLRRPDGRFSHLAQMPKRIAERAILTTTQSGDVVVDLFMGSGTTGDACVSTGRSFIGMEISWEYYNIAKRRIEEAQMQPQLMEVK